MGKDVVGLGRGGVVEHDGEWGWGEGWWGEGWGEGEGVDGEGGGRGVPSDEEGREGREGGGWVGGGREGRERGGGEGWREGDGDGRRGGWGRGWGRGWEGGGVDDVDGGEVGSRDRKDGRRWGGRGDVDKEGRGGVLGRRRRPEDDGRGRVGGREGGRGGGTQVWDASEDGERREGRGGGEKDKISVTITINIQKERRRRRRRDVGRVGVEEGGRGVRVVGRSMRGVEVVGKPDDRTVGRRRGHKIDSVGNRGERRDKRKRRGERRRWVGREEEVSNVVEDGRGPSDGVPVARNNRYLPSRSQKDDVGKVVVVNQTNRERQGGLGRDN